MNAGSLQFTATVNDAQLDRKIIEFAAETGRPVRDIGETVIKGLIRDVINMITPPSHQGATGKAAQRSGEQAIVRDLGLMGFAPVRIKGYREINTVFGHKLAKPVKVKTKLNSRFADPDAIHRARLSSRHGGRPTRGGKQAWYVDRSQFNAMRRRLFSEVGRLAAGFVPAADRFGVPVPAWIRRHGSGHGGSIEVSYENGIKIIARNHFPGTAAKEAEDTQRRIEIVKGYAIGRLQRQLEAKFKGLWKRG